MKQLLVIFTILSLSPLAATAAPSYAAFEKACQEQLEGHKKAKEVCSCMSRNFRIKQLTEPEVKMITARYQGDESVTVVDEKYDILFDFEEDVAALCLKNTKTTIKP